MFLTKIIIFKFYVPSFLGVFGEYVLKFILFVYLTLFIHFKGLQLK